jgi:hypothetical protein
MGAKPHMTRESNHPAQQTSNNTWAHQRGYTLGLYSLTGVQQFRTSVFEAPDYEHVGRNMRCTSDMKTGSTPVMGKDYFKVKL